MAGGRVYGVSDGEVGVRLADFNLEESIYVDANIFIYVVLANPRYLQPCKHFLERVERREVQAVISPLVLDEVAYKIVMEKLKIDLALTSNARVLDALKQDPGIVAKAEGELELFSFIIRSYQGLKLIPIPAHSGLDLFPKMLEEKLLPRDALHLLTMEAHGVKHIATSDPDFERAKGIEVWKP